MDNLKFLSEPITNDINNIIDIDGERYIINYMEELKFGEFVDVQTVLDADKDNFPAILSIICRKEGEIYNDEYIAKLQPKRMEMFAKQPVTKVYPIIGFFLNLSIMSENSTQLYLEKIKDQSNHILQHYINSLENGDGKKRYMKSAVKKLMDLKEQLNNI